MALGGFVYSTFLVPSFDHTDDALFESNVIDPMVSLIAGISGWSVATAKTKYLADSGWFAVFSHSGGAGLAVYFIGDTVSGTTYLHGSNTFSGTNRTGGNERCRVGFAYLPIGHSGIGAASPDLSGFLPSDSLAFFPASRLSGLISGHTTRFHFMARGDDLIVVAEYDTSVADGVTVMGTCLVPFHASDSGSRNGEGHLLRWATAYSTARDVQFFADDNTSRRWNVSGVIDNYSWLTSSVNDTAPWSYLDVLVGVPFTQGDTGIVGGVTSTSGFKGKVNNEFLRFTVPSGGPANKQRLSSGNLVHISEGVVVGYDAGNGALS